MNDSIETFEYEATPTGFFSMLARFAEEAGARPLSIRPRRPLPSRGQEELFTATGEPAAGLPPERISFIPPDGKAASVLIRKLEETDRMIVEILDLAFRSERPIEAEALTCVRLALSGRGEALRDEGRPEVRALRLAWRYALRELDRFHGILRFERGSGGAWEAVCEPEADILDLLPAHFEARLGGEAFRIRDLRRGTEVRGGSTAAPPEGLDAVLLWRRYYRVIENEGRRNEGLRKRFLPERYWKHLPELVPGAEGEGRRPRPRSRTSPPT